MIIIGDPNTICVHIVKKIHALYDRIRDEKIPFQRVRFHSRLTIIKKVKTVLFYKRLSARSLPSQLFCCVSKKSSSAISFTSKEGVLLLCQRPTLHFGATFQTGLRYIVTAPAGISPTRRNPEEAL